MRIINEVSNQFWGWGGEASNPIKLVAINGMRKINGFFNQFWGWGGETHNQINLVIINI